MRASSANSHKNKGWEMFTDAVIKWISVNLSNVVFLLWGDNAKVKSSLICKVKIVHSIFLSSLISNLYINLRPLRIYY